MKIDIGKNDKEIGLMSLRDNLIVLHNGERYTIEEYIDKLQNNWNELKKWLEEYYDYGDCLKINYILKKMQELEMI